MFPGLLNTLRYSPILPLFLQKMSTFTSAFKPNFRVIKTEIALIPMMLSVLISPVISFIFLTHSLNFFLVTFSNPEYKHFSLEVQVLMISFIQNRYLFLRPLITFLVNNLNLILVFFLQILCHIFIICILFFILPFIVGFGIHMSPSLSAF